MTTAANAPDDIAYVTVVESPACHFCADAEAVLAELAGAHPLVIRVVDIRTDVGRHLVQKHRATMSPLVLLDGEFFSNGRLPRRRLAKQLEQRFGTSPDSEAV